MRISEATFCNWNKKVGRHGCGGTAPVGRREPSPETAGHRSQSRYGNAAERHSG